MKKLLLSVAACLAVGTMLNAQTTLFYEDFETGGGTFTMNTGTMGGQVGLAGDNAWVVNSVYTGGSGNSSCFGFGFSIGNTPAQPAGIANQNGGYMHILSDDGTNNGILNANYSAADGSFCFFAQSHFTEMTNDVSTVGYTNVELNFWWTCLGDVSAHGQIYYSTDAGITWTQVTTPVATYYGSSSWANQSITNAAWDNQASLRFGFRFNNQVAASGGDPSFSIDDVKILGTSGGGSNAITTGTSLAPASWCAGQTTTIQVDFTSTGTFNAGNIYTAELSDGSGSFAAPTSIGTLASTANSGTITAIVPGATPAGAGYRIRVVSSNPATVGSDNGSDLAINALPTVTQQAFTDVCDNASPVNLVGGSPAGGTYSGTGVSAGTFDPTVPGVGQTNVTYTYTDGNGCSNSATEPITVLAAPTVTLSAFADVCDDDPFFTLTGGSPAGGTYTGPGVTAGVFDPATAGAGTHTITYTYTDGNGCPGTATETIFVDICGGIGENDVVYFTLYPNPAESVFEIKTDAQIEKVELRDMSGRLVRSFNAGDNVYTVENIPTGVYVVVVTTNAYTSQQPLMIK